MPLTDEQREQLAHAAVMTVQEVEETLLQASRTYHLSVEDILADIALLNVVLGLTD